MVSFSGGSNFAIVARQGLAQSPNNGTTDAPPAWKALNDNAWLIVPIVAAIGWIQTWIMAAILAGGDYGFVADRRYAGLAKRTMLPASLASTSSTPRHIIGCASMDPGLSTQLESLDSDKCRASGFSMATWAIQVLTTTYAIIFASIIWARDDILAAQEVWSQILQQLAALNINRGTWALAVLGCLVPYQRRFWLYVTTGIAVAFDILFLLRAFLIARSINQIPSMPTYMLVQAYTLPSLEGFVFVLGLIAVCFKIKYLGPLVFFPGALWLVFGPWVVVVISLLTHLLPQYINPNNLNNVT